MLSNDEKDYVTEKLIAMIAVLEKPRETLLGPFIGTTVPLNLGSGTPTALVMEILGICLSDGWNHDPPWLVLLLGLVPAIQDAKLAAIADRARIKPPAGPDPLDATILSNGTPFVDRTALRRQVRRLATDAAKAKPILIVNGSPKSGKSYSTQYIDHFSYSQAPTTTYRLELTPGTEMETGPEEVASDLVAMMGRPLTGKPPSQTNQKLLIQQFARWVLNEAVQSPAQHWIILDNFQGEKLRPDTRDFVIALADLITNGVFPQRCRLILIGFDRAQLRVDPGKLDEETIIPCPPGEIESCVREIAARGPKPVDAGALLAFVVSGLPANTERMAELNTRLRGLVRAVDQVGEITANQSVDFEVVLHEVLKDLPPGAELMRELEKRLNELRASVEELAHV